MRRMVLASSLLALAFAGRGLSAQLYRLSEDSSIQRGCFPPCLCPILEAQVRGMFEIVPRGCDSLFECYTVRNVYWWTELTGTEVLITGSGTYRVGGEMAVTQQLELDLRVGDEDVQHFDSGWVPGGGSFPAIDIPVSIHGFVCLDTGIFLKAAPLPLEQSTGYQARGSYEARCEPPCVCEQLSQPPIGSLSLVKIAEEPLLTDYAVALVHLEELPDQSPSPLLISGAGTYRIYRDGRDRMQLDLHVSAKGALRWRFKSAVEAPPRAFPSIDLTLAADTAATIGAISHQRIELHADPATVNR